MNNYWYTDAPAEQGGRFTFRYALTSGRDVSQTRATTLASEQRSPLLAIRHYSMGWPPTLSARGASFLSAQPEGLRILTIRPVENGDAYLVRVQNSTAEKIQAHLLFSTNTLGEAYVGSLSGDRLGSVDWTQHEITLAMGASEIKTLVVKVVGH
jgi:alpha-mannosidase